MLTPETLIATLRRLAERPSGRLHCCVAFSGGLDSTVLLHLLAQARRAAPGALRLRALHVDHGLQSAARDFRRQARGIAKRLRVGFDVLDVHVDTRSGRSVEEAAREARYAALRAALQPGELLLTAQHADDQLETVLLALLRGAGPAGLAGIAAAQPFGPGLLLRPLLEHTREQLQTIAQDANLEWIEDPSNDSVRFDRNYLRREVLPALRKRWPSAAVTVARSARHCGQAAQLEAALASRDVDTASDGGALDAAVLRRWPPARQRAALRLWCQRSGVRVPDERRLVEALRMLEAREDATPLLEWPGARLRLHRGRLLLSRVEPSVRGKGAASSLRSQQRGDEQPPTATPEPWHWQRDPDLHIANTGTLSLHADPQGDLDLARLPATLWLHWPRSGAVRAAGQSQRALRKRLQALAVPAWERDHLPLIFAGDPGPLIAIADLWLDPQFQAQPDSSHRGRLRWRPAC